MTTKTEWLDWLEAGAAQLKERYRQAWTRLPRRSPRPEPAPPEEPPGKSWCTIHARVERQPGEIVVHLELPAPHTVEADVRVIGSTLAIAVLRHGSGIQRARVEDCYRRAIPVPEQANPGSAVHQIEGDELVIRMQPKAAKRQSSDDGRAGGQRASNSRAASSQDDPVADQAPGRDSATRTGRGRRKDRKNQGRRGPAQVTELPVGAARPNRSDTHT